MSIGAMVMAGILGATPMPPAATASPSAFEGESLSDESLSGVHGTGLSIAAATTVRLLADANYDAIRRQLTASSQVSMDIWWSQTGAALIADNILAARAG